MQTQRDILVVSDLHTGDGGARDNFAADQKEDQFNLFLDYVTAQNAEFFVLVELLEFCQANIGLVLMCRMPLMDRLAEMQAQLDQMQQQAPPPAPAPAPAAPAPAAARGAGGTR